MDNGNDEVRTIHRRTDDQLPCMQFGMVLACIPQEFAWYASDFITAATSGEHRAMGPSRNLGTRIRIDRPFPAGAETHGRGRTSRGVFSAAISVKPTMSLK